MISSSDYTVRDFLALLTRRRKTLLAVAMPVVVVAATLAAILPDEYQSYSEININLEGAGVRTLEPIEVTTYADRYIAELQDSVLTRAKLLPLAEDPDAFDADQWQLTEGERIGLIKRSIRVSLVTHLVTSPTTGREVDLITGFKVASVSKAPEFVYRTADFVATLFLEADRLSRTQRASSTSNFLEEQMGLTEKDYVALENELADFKVANACCLPELVDFNMSVIQRAERDLENVQPRIRALEQDRSFLQAQLDDLRQTAQASDRLEELEQEYMSLVANYGPDHPDVNRVQREISALTSVQAGNSDTLEIIELKIKLREAEEKYSSEHPDVIKYRKQLETLEAENRRLSRSGDSSLRDDPRYLQLRKELNAIDSQLLELRRAQPALQQKIQEHESYLARTPQVESEYQAITRKLQSTRDTFDDLQRRAVIAKQSAALESTDIGARLIQVSKAELPRAPSGPPRMAILVVGIFLAGTLSFGAMLFVEMSDNTIRAGKDVGILLDLAPIATVPVIANKSSLRKHKRQRFIVRGSMLVGAVALILLFVRDLL